MYRTLLIVVAFGVLIGCKKKTEEAGPGGGEASVLKAIDTRHERLVALKVRVVPPDGSTDA